MRKSSNILIWQQLTLDFAYASRGLVVWGLCYWSKIYLNRDNMGVSCNHKSLKWLFITLSSLFSFFPLLSLFIYFLIYWNEFSWSPRLGGDSLVVWLGVVEMGFHHHHLLPFFNGFSNLLDWELGLFFISWKKRSLMLWEMMFWRCASSSLSFFFLDLFKWVFIISYIGNWLYLIFERSFALIKYYERWCFGGGFIIFFSSFPPLFLEISSVHLLKAVRETGGCNVM